MIVVGLGNPGAQYAATVHNAGFMAIDRIADKLGLKLKNKGCASLYAEQYIGGKKVVFAKPQTYMNLSGEAIKQLCGAFRATPQETLIIYDDIDLPIGAIRIRAEGSGGTHNGMRSVVAELGTKAIPRIRIGVGDDRGKMELRDYVLSKVSGEKKEKLDAVLACVAECVAEYVREGDLEAIMRKYNKKVF